MITAVDTNVLLDVLIPDSPHRDASRTLISESRREGITIISEPVYSEMSVAFPEREHLDRFLGDNGIRPQPTNHHGLYFAGRTWRAYLDRRPRLMVCPSCGSAQDVSCDSCEARLSTRQHVIADFTIGAHAEVHVDRLLTRDLGYFGTYFPNLSMVQPPP